MFSFSLDLSTTFLAIVKYTASSRVEFISFVSDWGFWWYEAAAAAATPPREKPKQNTRHQMSQRGDDSLLSFFDGVLFFFLAFHLSPIAAVAPTVSPSTPAPPLERYYFLMKCFCRRRSADAATTAQRNKPTLSIFFSFFLSLFYFDK